jgi:hypothetical protein
LQLVLAAAVLSIQIELDPRPMDTEERSLGGRGNPIPAEVQLEYLDATILRRGVGEIRAVVGRDPAC